MRIHKPLLSTILLAGLSLSGTVSADPPELQIQPVAPLLPEQTAEEFEGSIPVSLEYWLTLPQSYGVDPNEEWPLMLFLHGAGERGDDLNVVKKHGPPHLIDEGKLFPMIVVSPQCPKDQLWQPAALLALIDDLSDQYRIDQRRIYVTGLSMGGFGTWGLAAYAPDRIAAAVPICGGGETLNARQIAKVPVWAFHGAKDPVVPIKRSEEMVEAVEKAGGDIKFTVYPEAVHDSWTETYANDQIYSWMLQHYKTSE